MNPHGHRCSLLLQMNQKLRKQTEGKFGKGKKQIGRDLEDRHENVGQGTGKAGGVPLGEKKLGIEVQRDVCAFLFSSDSFPL